MANPPPRSFALVETRRRYEPTPRALDDDLQRMARGDRGCLGDAIAGAGALGILVFGVLGYMGFTGIGFTAVAAALLIGGFFVSAMATARSGPVRYKALTEGPLVLARVLRVDPALKEPGDVPHPALVLFAVDPPHRFDAKFLREVAGPILALQSATSVPPEQVAVATMLRDPNRVEVLRVPSELAGGAEAYLGVVSVDPRRLPARKIEDDVVPVIADPGRGFVEHV
jgi:hypothetical protein